jgi:broad specificity phosphatase PhoE
MGIVYVVQHGEKERRPGDPGLTGRGREQAALAAERVRHRVAEDGGLRAVYASPLLRARQTAAAVAAAVGLPVLVDARVTERMNWDGTFPFERFAEDWAKTTADRDFVPARGDSSRAAGERFRAFLAERAGDGPIAVACHGGVTVDLLRTLMGDAAVPQALLREGVRSGAITVIDGEQVLEVAAVDHLAGLESPHRKALAPVRYIARSLWPGPLRTIPIPHPPKGDRSLGRAWQPGTTGIGRERQGVIRKRERWAECGRASLDESVQIGHSQRPPNQ